MKMRKFVPILALFFLLACKKGGTAKEEAMEELRNDPLLEKYVTTSLDNLSVMRSEAVLEGMKEAKKSGTRKEFLAKQKTAAGLTYTQSQKNIFYYYGNLYSKYVDNGRLTSKDLKQIFLEEISVQQKVNQMEKSKNK